MLCGELRGSQPLAVELDGPALLRAGRPREALAAFVDAARREPGAAGPILGLAQACFLLGRFDDAFRLTKRLRRLYPDDPELADLERWIERCADRQRERQGCLQGKRARVRTMIVDSIEALAARLGLARLGDVREPDIDWIETECDWFERKRRDAEVLTTLAVNSVGPCLDLGTSFGRSAFRLATNLTPPHCVWTVNMLPEQHAGQGELVTHLLSREQIGSYFRERGLDNVRQVYANTLAWDMPAEIDRLALAFIDACHDEVAVWSDSVKAWQRLAAGGLLAWHDFSPWQRAQHAWIDAVMRGVERFIDDTFAGATVEVVHLRGSWIGVLRKDGSA